MNCRPCSLGNHDGIVCADWVPVDKYLWKYEKRCASCGFDPSLHPLPPELGG